MSTGNVAEVNSKDAPSNSTDDSKLNSCEDNEPMVVNSGVPSDRELEAS